MSQSASAHGVVTVRARAHLLKAHVSGEKPAGSGGRRGRVVGFSRASRKRLLEMMASLDCEGKRRPLFFTVTYPAEFPDLNTARRHFDNLRKRIVRRYPQAALIWRLELQKRGAPHFHVLLWNVPFLPFVWLQASWRAIIGYEGPHKLQVKIERLRSWRGVMSYVAKYMAKAAEAYTLATECMEKALDDVDFAPVGGVLGCEAEAEATAGGELDYSAYLTGLFGRLWGVTNREGLPWGEVLEAELPWGRWFWCLKRCGRHVWRRLGSSAAGFTLFRDDVYSWWALADRLALANSW